MLAKLSLVLHCRVSSCSYSHKDLFSSLQCELLHKGKPLGDSPKIATMRKFKLILKTVTYHSLCDTKYEITSVRSSERRTAHPMYPCIKQKHHSYLTIGSTILSTSTIKRETKEIYEAKSH